MYSSFYYPLPVLPVLPVPGQTYTHFPSHRPILTKLWRNCSLHGNLITIEKAPFSLNHPKYFVLRLSTWQLSCSFHFLIYNYPRLSFTTALVCGSCLLNWVPNDPLVWMGMGDKKNSLGPQKSCICFDLKKWSHGFGILFFQCYLHYLILTRGKIKKMIPDFKGLVIYIFMVSLIHICGLVVVNLTTVCVQEWKLIWIQILCICQF